MNSFHHRAIGTLGRDPELSARAPEDGIIQSVDDPRQQALFRALVEASAR